MCLVRLDIVDKYYANIYICIILLNLVKLQLGSGLISFTHFKCVPFSVFKKDNVFG